ncbi:MAG: hypothetical protein HY537_16700 [Deltaproteobacteria bacterium]|nr:hypothetical protein [Deltaproteobacteria bacterium]
MVYKVTIDGGLLRNSVLLPAVQTLKAWEADGKIEIFESDRAKEVNVPYTWPGATPQAKNRPRFRAPRKMKASDVSFQQISSVLFPQRDPKRLNLNEINDVAHLLSHRALGHSIFVTTNMGFIADGKRERLMSVFKIVVLTPDEAVSALMSTQPWNEANENRGPG